MNQKKSQKLFMSVPFVRFWHILGRQQTAR